MSAFRTVESSDPVLTPSGFTFCTVHSGALDRRADVVFYNADCQRDDVPVIVLLHGVYGSAWSWAFQGGVHLVFERLRSLGEVGDFALVMPSDGLHGDGSGYINRKEGRFQDWIMHEVIELARRQVERMTEQSRIYIAGLSMGGYGALRLGALNSSVFSGISAHSAVCDIADFKHFSAEDPTADAGEPDVRLSVAGLLARNKATLPPIRFDCGSKDILRASNNRLASALIDADVPHTYEKRPGGHDWAYWGSAIERSFRFFDRIERKRSGST